MSKYPEHLLPHPYYNYIAQGDFLSHRGLILIRHIESGKVIWEEGTNLVRRDCIEIQSNHLGDLSCNLLGVFQKEDIFYKVCDEYKEKYYALWEEFTEGLSPGDDQFTIDEDRGGYFIPIDKLFQSDIPFVMNGEKYRFMVFHTPTKCNFWHVSIKVLNSKDEEVSKVMKGKPQRKILSMAKSILIRLIIETECDAFVTIPQECFMVSSSLTNATP